MDRSAAPAADPAAIRAAAMTDSAPRSAGGRPTTPRMGISLSAVCRARPHGRTTAVPAANSRSAAAPRMSSPGRRTTRHGWRPRSTHDGTGTAGAGTGGRPRAVHEQADACRTSSGPPKAVSSQQVCPTLPASPPRKGTQAAAGEGAGGVVEAEVGAAAAVTGDVQQLHFGATHGSLKPSPAPKEVSRNTL